MAPIALCCFLLALAATGTQAQTPEQPQAQPQNGTDIIEFLSANGYNLTVALIAAANMTQVMRDPAAMYTLLVPNDTAISVFFGKMKINLTSAELSQERPELAKQILAQHIIPKANLREQDIFSNLTSRVVGTVAGKPNDLLFRAPTGANKSATVTDVQGNVANIRPGTAIDQYKSVLPIDKLLLPDSVFLNMAAMCKFRTFTVSEFCNAVYYADLSDNLMGSKFKSTVFVPNNKAFASVLRLTRDEVPSISKTQDVLKYHVVPGVHLLPRELKNSTESSLDGQMLNVSYQIARPAPGEALRWPYTKATVLTSANAQVPVIKANVFVGKGVVHGIDEVLIPGNATASTRKKMTTAEAKLRPAKAGGNATAAAAAKTRPTRPMRNSTAGGAMRKRPAKKAAANTTAATAPGARRRMLSFTEAAGARSLLGFGFGPSAGSTAATDAATDAIIAAARGYTTSTFASLQTAHGTEELGVPGAYNDVDRGIIPW